MKRYGFQLCIFQDLTTLKLRATVWNMNRKIPPWHSERYVDKELAEALLASLIDNDDVVLGLFVPEEDEKVWHRRNMYDAALAVRHIARDDPEKSAALLHEADALLYTMMQEASSRKRVLHLA